MPKRNRTRKKRKYKSKSKKRSIKLLGPNNKIPDYLKKKFKDKSVSEKMDHILKKYGLLALPLIHRTLVESQYSWDEWSSWRLRSDKSYEPGPENPYEPLKEAIIKQARNNGIIN